MPERYLGGRWKTQTEQVGANLIFASPEEALENVCLAKAFDSEDSALAVNFKKNPVVLDTHCSFQVLNEGEKSMMKVIF